VHGGVDNTRALGRLIYTHYALVFQASGLVLLVAMIGAIVLTLRQRPGVKRQDIGRQLSRTRDTGVEIVKIKPRTGV
jgi:NADH-quinone oxidoreductase subunit J